MEMRRSAFDDDRLERALAELGARCTAPPAPELQRMARAAAARAQDTPRSPSAPARPRRLTLAWTALAVAVALLLGSALGFGLASSATPTGAAGTTYAGFGFLPARGWTVVQGGQLGADGSTTATAANVPLELDPRTGAVPSPMRRSLPRGGIVIQATFTTRGDPAEDASYPERALPLEVASSRAAGADATGLAIRRLRAGVRSYNIDVLVSFGRANPTPAMLRAAQEQLDRLVVASEQVSIFARPLVVDQVGQTTLYGAIDRRAAGERVDIQARECGQRFFRGVAGTTTREDGSWSLEYAPGITATLRAVWNGVASPPVVVRAQATVDLSRRGTSPRYSVSVRGQAQFWRRLVEIQRRVGGRWRTVRTVTLTETYSYPGVSWMVSAADFRASFPEGSTLRAVLPASQAKPCYLAGVSRTLRT